MFTVLSQAQIDTCSCNYGVNLNAAGDTVYVLSYSQGLTVAKIHIEKEQYKEQFKSCSYNLELTKKLIQNRLNQLNNCSEREDQYMFQISELKNVIDAYEIEQGSYALRERKHERQKWMIGGSGVILIVAALFVPN